MSALFNMAVWRCFAACDVKHVVSGWRSLSSARLGSEAQSCSEKEIAAWELFS